MSPSIGDKRSLAEGLCSWRKSDLRQQNPSTEFSARIKKVTALQGAEGHGDRCVNGRAGYLSRGQINAGRTIDRNDGDVRSVRRGDRGRHVIPRCAGRPGAQKAVDHHRRRAVFAQRRDRAYWEIPSMAKLSVAIFVQEIRDYFPAPTLQGAECDDGVTAIVALAYERADSAIGKGFRDRCCR